MAKTAIASTQESQPVKSAGPNQVSTALEQARNFLHDVRSETRKVVSPSRKEVQATTTVVIVTVFVFAAFFWAVDGIFGYGLQQLLRVLGGQ